jgi:heme a synthase
MTDATINIDKVSTKKPPIGAAKANTWLRRWLKVIVAMIFAMVLVGGATRLTNSGLSITEWDPIKGAIPPMNAADWQEAFSKYQQSPQFKLTNQGMSLGEFQYIFWWEWVHRFWGRLIGLPFVVLFVMAIFRRIEWRTCVRLVGLFILLGLQGALGWYMVASGLVDRVDVSQYRLAAHLSLAMVFLAATLWTLFSVGQRHDWPRSLDQWAAVILLLLVLLQIAAGGFVAGLDAGQAYNTWPAMDGQYLPDGLNVMTPSWRNLFENAVTVQFNHRMLAYAIFIFAIWHALRSFTLSAMLVFYAAFTQACIGILALLLHVPIAVALVHQAGATIVLLSAVWNLHCKLVMPSLVQDPP